MSMDYGSMPMHFLAEGDDPPVIMIPEPAGAGAGDEATQDGDEELAADSGSAARPRPRQRPGPGPAPAPAPAPDRPERSYECALCEYETSSPRTYLTHLRCVHHERMQIYECPHCTYASRHSQKMQRHVSMVHDPARGERRRPGPPPRERDDYYDDFVNEMHKRQAARIVKKRQQQLLQQEHNVAMAARAVAAAAAAESKPRRSPPTCTVTRSSPPTCTITRSSPPTCTVTQSSPPASIVTRSPLADGSDDDDDDRLVIDQLDDYDAPEDDGGSVVERADDTSPSPPDDGSPQPRASSVITSTGVIRDGLEDPSPGPQHHDHVEPHAFATWPQPQQGGGGRRGVRLERDPVTRAYKCSSCDFTSRAPSLVARHESVVHLKKRFYRCSKCTYVTHIRARFTKHFKYHTMPLIKCDDCDFQSPYRWNLERHVKNHGGSGRYMCRACNFSADIRQSLTVHEMNHHVPPVAHPDDIRAQTRRRQLKAAAAAQLLAAAAAAAKEDGIKADAEDHDPDADRPRRPSVDSGAGGSPDAPPAAPTSTRPPLRCSLCTFRTPFIAVMSKHMSAEHTKPRPLASPALEAAPGQGLGPPPAKRPAKPLPNLIPIGVPLSQVRGPGVAPTPAPTPGPAAPADSTPLPAANGDDAHSADTAKKKNSFFDQLRLYPGTGAGSELVCVHCGHEAKCLSELTRHNKLHQGTSRALGTSTRCQHCRHRCKTSGDLAQHLRTCAKAAAAVAADSDPAADPLGLGDRLPPAPAPAVHAPAPAAAEAEDLTCADMESDIAAAAEANNAAVHAAHPVNIPSLLNDEDDDAEPLYHGQPMPDSDIPKADVSLVGVETAPGYGSVLERTDFEAKAAKENVPTPPVAPKKVFKCPHCSFWAATASRFHVHIVGHANKKPFACSICMYRSNWRWDITKHIKRIKDTKDAKDHSHNEAKILMTDDSGRRNYAKYYRHYLWLNVAEQLLDGLQSLINTYQKQYAGQVNPTSGEAGPALPAPPKLTRAPAPRTVPIPTSSPGALLRPPPPLQAAGQHPSAQVIILPGGARLGPQAMEQPGQMTPQQPQQQSLKRSADTPVPNVGSDPKRSNPEIKKTVWRCKQCHFRDGDRAVVLAHVKGHYRQQQEAFALAKLKNSQASGTQESNVDTQKRTDPEQTVVRKVPFRCDVCPYVSLNETTFQAHVNCHKERNDVLFKCFYCPFYVSTKEEVIQHMTVHQTSVKPENSVPAKTTAPQPSSNKEPAGIKIHIKKEAGLPDQDPSYSCNEVESPNQPLRPPPLDFTNMTEAPVCWVFRDEKLQKMLRCRFCPHVNLRKANMQEHEKMHLKRASLGSDGLESTGQYTQYHCPDCSYVCNNAGVLSTHTRVHSSSYPLSYTFYDPYRNEILQMKEIMEKYSLKPKIEETPKSSPPKEAVDTVNENKLCGINVMSLLDPNQSLTDAVLAMKKKFNLELDGEPFAEPVEDSAESPPCSPLKPLNDGSDPIATDTVEEKQLHFCNLCPARFLFRKELGIHSRFHNLYLIHKCDHCTYTARQRPHLQAHFKVHTADYQDRTTALMNMYKVNKEFPMPRIVCDTISGNLWIVATTPEYEEPLAPSPKFSCQKCPASFFKTEAYQAHLALHGSNNPHKCRICDYAVKSYGDLVKHMMSHGCRRTVAKKILQGQMEVPASLGGDTRNSQSTSRFEQPIVVHKEETPASDDNGSGNADITCPSIKEDMDEREDFPVDSGNLEGASSQEKSESDFKEKENSPSKSPSSSADTSGSPEFIYPTLCRNGRVKVKKYKCKKCPSAFEKHDQYLVHMNLHGSKQRYKCPHCDYSVKFLANHIQHLRRHKINDDAKESPKNDLESSSSEDKEMVPEDSENIPTPPPSSPTRSAKTTGGKGEKLSVADKQAIMVLQQRRAKRAAVSRESLDKNYWCSHCPYSSPRRDQVESHMRRHVCVSGVRSVYICDHCDYSVPNKHFLRDHCKLHFDVSKAPRPDAYMICNALELFTSSGFSGKNKSKGKIMIFQDKGSNVTSDRFLPPLPAELNDDSSDGSNKIFINPKTFESESFSENGSKDNFDTAESDNYAGNELDNKPKEKSCDGSGKEKDLSEPPAATLTFPEATSHNSGSVVENYILSKAS